MKHNKVAGIAIVGAALALSPAAEAQNVINANSHGQAGALIALGGFGGWGGGGRIDLEYQLHFRGRYEGPGLGLGVTLPLWAGFGIGFEGRFMYDIQPIAGTAFFITPYVGLSTGFWSWAYNCGGGGRTCVGAGYFWLGPELGLDFKVVLFDRLLIGFRLPGFSLPILVGNNAGIGWGFHAGFTIGVTF
jgi:hypothetical protein